MDTTPDVVTYITSPANPNVRIAVTVDTEYDAPPTEYQGPTVIHIGADGEISCNHSDSIDMHALAAMAKDDKKADSTIARYLREKCDAWTVQAMPAPDNAWLVVCDTPELRQDINQFDSDDEDPFTLGKVIAAVDTTMLRWRCYFAGEMYQLHGQQRAETGWESTNDEPLDLCLYGLASAYEEAEPLLNGLAAHGQ